MSVAPSLSVTVNDTVKVPSVAYVCEGATPLAVTDCLNFGSPENPEIMWQFAEALRGLGDGCRELETPVVSGNVSFYNETDQVPIKPTPMIAMVGLLDDVSTHRTMAFAGPGITVAVVGELGGGLGASEYLATVHGSVRGRPVPYVHAQHKPVFDAVLAMGSQISSCHDISDGGLFVALAECCLTAETKVGIDFELSHPSARADELLFGEGPARFVIGFAETETETIAGIAQTHGVPMQIIGRTGGATITGKVCGQPIEVAIDDALHAWTEGFRSVAS